MNVRVMSVLRPSIHVLFPATKPEHAGKNGGKAIGPGFREAGAGGSNPLSPTNIFNRLYGKSAYPSGAVSELCPCNVDPPGKKKAPASLAGDARADLSMDADWLANPTDDGRAAQ